MDKNNRKMGIGVIVRDSMGEVLATLSAPKEHIIALDIAEATAALSAITFIRELGLYKVVMEGDVLIVVQALMSFDKNWSCYDHLIEEARGLLNCMHTWKVNHVRQQLNCAAHHLANEALALGEEQALIEEVPICISSIIYVERCT